MNLFRALLLHALLLTVAGLPLAALPGRPLEGPPAQAGERSPSPRAEESRWTWPLSPRPRVLRPFRPPPQRWLSGHRGADLAAAQGTAVLSPAPGTVAFAGTVAGRGVIVVDHGEGVRSSFEPVSTGLPRGEHVERGQELGTVAGATHCAEGYLHWGVRVEGAYADPLAFLGLDSRPSVLLPLG
ncbi:M23 family metallopeptidase [Arthrobacter sp. UM1]|uniref:M23 family metallopeptidase n=1 Tax=Arthrobacter sp. UM1 TaxID=2766776 RepID=UPI001CF61244|nr:M23 family metallopeptidase [Arthrobacter sp. UM1]MCB4208059.1 M23 family metallopeptidase [Arthrobacter sp. UM1]